MVLEILVMMTTKLTELNKCLTLLMFRRLFHSKVATQMSHFILQRSRKRELLVKIIQIHMAISNLLVIDF